METLKQGIIVPQYHNLQRLFISAIQTLNPSLKMLAFEWFGTCLFYFFLLLLFSACGLIGTDGLQKCLP